MKRLSILVIVFSLVSYSGISQDFNQKIFQFYISGDMDSWENLLNANRQNWGSPDEQYEYAMAHYGFIGYCLGRDQKSRARPYLDRVEKITDDLLLKVPNDARVIALRGALYGFRISYQPQKAMFIGPKALKFVNLAIDKNQDCPQAWIESGNKDWFMPEIFGGSKTQAMANYEKAIKLMEKNPAYIRENWYYLNVHIILGDWYGQRGRSFASREVYRKLLEIEPEFVWAKEKLAK
jgi:tetratricopeptide (TPR) repeat protein